MPRFRLTLLLALASLGVLSSASWSAVDTPPRLVRVNLDPNVTVERLFEVGVDVIEIKRGSHCLVLEWPGDEAKLGSIGARVTLVDADPGRTAAERARADFASRPAPPRKARPSGSGLLAPPPFGSGGMGGYWTLAEVKMKLDQLVGDDTQNLVADQIDSIGATRQNRPVWGLKIGKAVSPPDTRPVAYYSAVTHAREPEGMQALFYFVDDLLSKYGTDPTATYLLDHRVVYIVPIVNPDGYVRNQTTNPNGGGLWRKNLRDNNNNSVVDNNDGVDINRNYGFQWGLGSGSSPLQSAADYRGPAAFSEPETQAQRDIVTLLRPVTGISFHTYSDLWLSPWGYTTAAPPDSNKFHEWNDEVTTGANGYLSGQGPRILYPVSGEFNDWCYGDTLLKPRAYTWTPEVGGPFDGFWPAPSRIVPLAEENLRGCYYVASIAGPYVRVESASLVEGTLDAGFSAHVSVRAKNRGQTGLAGPGLAATMTSLSAGASVLSGAIAYPDLSSFQSADATGGATFQVAADDTVTPGRLLRFRVDFSAPDGFFSRDTVDVLAGTPTVLFSDGGHNGLGLWTGGWGIETTDPNHAGPIFSDSPNANYPQSADDPHRITAPFDLSAGVHAYAFYDARWIFEENYDCGLVEGSLDGVNWTPLTATGSSLGREAEDGTQPVGGPVYDGSRYLWAPERADLSAFTGPAATAARFRFRVRSDVGTQLDGMRVDSVRIVLFDPAQQPLPVAVGDAGRGAFALATPSPNPARGPVRLSFTLPTSGEARLEVLDVQGRRVRTLASGARAAGQYAHGWDLRDERGHPVAAGVYLARLSGTAGTLTRRFVVMR